MTPITILAHPVLLVEWCGPGLDADGDRVLVDGVDEYIVRLNGAVHCYGRYGDWCGYDGGLAISLDLTRREVQDQVSRVMAADLLDVSIPWAPELLYCPDDGVWSLGSSHPDAPGEVAFHTFGPVGSDADTIVPGIDEAAGLPEPMRYATALRLCWMRWLEVQP